MTRRKSGGREARIALRNAPLKEEEKPIFIGFLRRLDLVMRHLIA